MFSFPMRGHASLPSVEPLTVSMWEYMFLLNHWQCPCESTCCCWTTDSVHVVSMWEDMLNLHLLCVLGRGYLEPVGPLTPHFSIPAIIHTINVSLFSGNVNVIYKLTWLLSDWLFCCWHLSVSSVNIYYKCLSLEMIPFFPKIKILIDFSLLLRHTYIQPSLIIYFAEILL